jgi:hypothetical protein
MKSAVPLVRPWQRELVDYALQYGMGKDGLLFRPNTSFTHALYRGCDCITTTRAIAAVMGEGEVVAVDEDEHVVAGRTRQRARTGHLHVGSAYFQLARHPLRALHSSRRLRPPQWKQSRRNAGRQSCGARAGSPLIPLERRRMDVVSNRGQRDRSAALRHDCFQWRVSGALGAMRSSFLPLERMASCTSAVEAVGARGRRSSDYPPKKKLASFGPAPHPLLGRVGRFVGRHSY